MPSTLFSLLDHPRTLKPSLLRAIPHAVPRVPNPSIVITRSFASGGTYERHIPSWHEYVYRFQGGDVRCAR